MINISWQISFHPTRVPRKVPCRALQRSSLRSTGGHFWRGLAGPGGTWIKKIIFNCRGPFLSPVPSLQVFSISYFKQYLFWYKSCYKLWSIAKKKINAIVYTSISWNYFMYLWLHQLYKWKLRCQSFKVHSNGGSQRTHLYRGSRRVCHEYILVGICGWVQALNAS